MLKQDTELIQNIMLGNNNFSKESFAKKDIAVKTKKIDQGVLKQMGLDDREYFNHKSGKTFINTVRGYRFKKK